MERIAESTGLSIRAENELAVPSARSRSRKSTAAGREVPDADFADVATGKSIAIGRSGQAEDRFTVTAQNLHAFPNKFSQIQPCK